MTKNPYVFLTYFQMGQNYNSQKPDMRKDQKCRVAVLMTKKCPYFPRV